MGCLLGFIVFYPEIEGYGVGLAVPLSLAMTSRNMSLDNNL
jgi:hypothetical protein